MKRLLLLLILVIASTGPPALAQTKVYFLSPDVPTPLGGPHYLPWDIVYNNAGTYSVPASLGTGVAVDAVHQMCSGDWLLSVEAPVDLPAGGGVYYDPRDVFQWDGMATYMLFFCPSQMGLQPGPDLDAAFLVTDDTSDIVVSFDVPTDLTPLPGGAPLGIVDPADLIRFMRTGPGCMGWTVVGYYFDASGPGVPVSSNVTGADKVGGGGGGTRTILTADVPTVLGGSYRLPGTLMFWNGITFGLYDTPTGWPIAGSSRVDALSMLAGPGSVPNISLRVNKSIITPGDLNLRWWPSTSVTATDYGIYEGPLPTIWYTHTAIDCHDNLGDLQEEVTPIAGNTYYLVVPFNDSDEGSYGKHTNGFERPQGSPGTCKTTQDLDCP